MCATLCKFFCPSQRTRENVGRSDETGIAHRVTELGGSCYVSQLPPARLLQTDGIQETTELEPVLCTVHHLWTGTQNLHLEKL